MHLRAFWLLNALRSTALAAGIAVFGIGIAQGLTAPTYEETVEAIPEPQLVLAEEYTEAEAKPMPLAAGGVGIPNPNPVVPAEPEPPRRQPTHYTTLTDFEAAAKGMCPHEVPESWWPDKLSPRVSLGYTNLESPSIDTLFGAALYVFDYYEQRTGSEVALAAWRFGDYPKGAYLYLDYATGSLYVGDWLDKTAQPSLTTAEFSSVQTLADTITGSVQSLHSAFVEKCGTY